MQSSECLLYWNQGIVYCTCGHLLRENKSSRDPMAIQKEHFIAHTSRKRCIKKSFEGIHDRFQKDLKIRDSQLRMDRTEEIRIQMDEVAQKDFTYRMSSEEFLRYEKTWSISQHIWTKCTDETPIRLQRSIKNMHRFHRESGEERLATIPFWQYQKWHPSSSSSSTSWWQWNDHWWSS